MLTNQIIGAGQNVASHTPRPVAQSDAVTPTSQAPAQSKPTDQMTPVAVLPQSNAAKTDADGYERAALSDPKKVDLKVAVPDTIPDAEPESIYKANTAEPPPNEAA